MLESIKIKLNELGRDEITHSEVRWLVEKIAELERKLKEKKK